MGGITTQTDLSTNGRSQDQLPTHPHSPELDDFGLPRRPVSRGSAHNFEDSENESETFHDAEAPTVFEVAETDVNGEHQSKKALEIEESRPTHETLHNEVPETESPLQQATEAKLDSHDGQQTNLSSVKHVVEQSVPEPNGVGDTRASDQANAEQAAAPSSIDNNPTAPHDLEPASHMSIPKRERKTSVPTVSEWSHQRQITKQDEKEEEEEEEWQAMQAIDEFDIYDDDGFLVAKGKKKDEEELNPYAGIGGAGKGYTRVQLDEDAQSATSMDDDTDYLFKNGQKSEKQEDVSLDLIEEEDEQRDALSQLQATKDLLTEGQRIAYVGVVRLTIYKMFHALSDMETTRSTKKEIGKALESMDKWGQKMMVYLYAHMDISPAEQVMIEQLAEHGVQPADLVTPLMLNAKVKNPLATDKSDQNSDQGLRPHAPNKRDSSMSGTSLKGDSKSLNEPAEEDEVPQVHGPSDMPQSKNIDLDIRWTVLCDLFLVLISDSVYDARSRRLLERVGSAMQISWVQICRFEKRVIDSLEMQEEDAKENWDESENLERRRKLGLKRKYMVMGLATVGGGLVIGLSAGLLAPVIGAGLAAGFTTIGVTGTAGFLGGVGGAALITSGATVAGGTIAVRASDRRTGHVKTFEYRPLHNNKRLNLILTVAGWMNGKVDDIRLPYSTVDPIMGDIYSLLWEPEMLQSMGDTINILATEALTQTVQQVLGSTILVALMASIQLPVVLSKLAYLIDNPWSVSLDRANAAGLILADSLIDRHLGQRPITLVGFSLGSRVIFACLKELSSRGAYGLIQNVYLFGSPVVAKKDEYLRARSVVSGRFLNGYASNDWILGYLFRATSGGIMRVAGLAPVEGVPGIENLDVSKLVNGHMAYRVAMPKLMREVGWEVESDEFTEIEDPDPENHMKRQRELIQEIDEARKKAEEKPEKKRFGLFKRGKLAEKRGWEMYNASENNQKRSASQGPDTTGTPHGDLNVLFDIDAIRKELESEMIEVHELKSTLPPMQITSIKDGQKHLDYVRLPPEVSPEDVAKMSLPPRPDQIDLGLAPIRPVRVSSMQPTPKVSIERPSRMSPQPSPGLNSSRSLNVSPAPPNASFDYIEPKELISTMPPLSLTPSLRPESSPAVGSTRPELKTHATAPEPSSWKQDLGTDVDMSNSMTDLNIERNAWADDDYDEFGQRRNGDISMSFGI